MDKLPDYIQIPTVIMKSEGMTFVDGYVYGIIYWYSKMKLKKCTLSNKKIAKMLGIHHMSVSKSINKLKEAGFIQVRIDEDAGSSREIIPVVTYGGVSPSAYTPKPTDLAINNKKNIEEEFKTKVLKAKTPQGSQLQEKGEEDREFGNKSVNNLMYKFKELYGFEPTDRRPRNEAWNLVRRMKKRMEERGTEVSQKNMDAGIASYFKWISQQDWSPNVQTMSVIRRKFDMYLATIKPISKKPADELTKFMQEYTQRHGT